jgi:pyruvate/2-oxoglutarate dehydrogenase complex dihydrolipoamide dehydrogenase (E3) component
MSEQLQLPPWDASNQRLVGNVHPATWRQPVPEGRYHLVVIGAGTAGLVTAAGAAGLGAKVALVERSLMGGDCLNFGCVPSKGLIAAARVAATVREARAFGIEAPDDVPVDFARAMERMRGLRARISVNDSAERFRKLGVDVYFGSARFVDGQTVEVGGVRLPFRRAVIATGARAKAPPIPGLETVEYLTNETLYSLTSRPDRLGVIGAGPIGCEMAQAFARLGSRVVLVESGQGILPREDRDAAAVVEASLRRDGVVIRAGGRNLSVRREEGIRLSYEIEGVPQFDVVDQLLVATGRAPNVEDINLAAVGVDVTAKGVVVNDRLQTTNANIYAAGDVCSRFQFTHAADFQARIVIQNSLFRGRKRASSLVIPWCTYTSPELAHVGLLPEAARAQGIEVNTYTQPLEDVDRAILDGAEAGFVRVHCRKGTDRIVGATVVAEHAGDLVSELTLAMTHGLGLSKIGSTIHPYPTQADAIRKLGDQYNRTRLTPFVKSLFGRWLAWTR